MLARNASGFIVLGQWLLYQKWSLFDALNDQIPMNRQVMS